MTVPLREAPRTGRPRIEVVPRVEEPRVAKPSLGYRAAAFFIDNALSRVLFTTQSDPNSAKSADEKKPVDTPAKNDPDAKKDDEAARAIEVRRRLVLFTTEQRRTGRVQRSLRRR